ncbi:NAD(P)H-binding protein [Phototrophicus methaneseepsis]|uniref:NAD(P)H-binding protein n=1 Tax=Phototrophicus methaneseepsis TaxID=2710758 RepID=A0A7S8IER5_9CHLR|nr:NAD(P)H-binding protein [Phototrophicus methaneseepsis]QPC83970.1 NAD(P)H-binding protein [Phototrophicus methaneseepsis]
MVEAFAENRWMLYGATGFTGTLVAEEAVKRGHSPILAGRNAEKLRSLARRLGLKYVAFDLDDVNTIARHIADIDVVYHAAGPFIFTSDSMIHACLATHTHYLDISGELAVFENTFSYDEAARRNRIALISGVGFDVVPTDCLVAYVARHISAPSTLEVGIGDFGNGLSAGTFKSTLEILPNGNTVRRDGKLQSAPFSSKEIPMPGGLTKALSVPWGDVATAYRTTGIRNITAYMALPGPVVTLAQALGPLFSTLTKNALFRRSLSLIGDRLFTGPTEAKRETQQVFIWARATNPAGESKEAWLVTPEAYRFTAEIAIEAIERTLSQQPFGALTPSLAFGEDFVLAVPGVERADTL